MPICQKKMGTYTIQGNQYPPNRSPVSQSLLPSSLSCRIRRSFARFIPSGAIISIRSTLVAHLCTEVNLGEPMSDHLYGFVGNPHLSTTGPRARNNGPVDVRSVTFFEVPKCRSMVFPRKRTPNTSDPIRHPINISDRPGIFLLPCPPPGPPPCPPVMHLLFGYFF